MFGAGHTRSASILAVAAVVVDDFVCKRERHSTGAAGRA